MAGFELTLYELRVCEILCMLSAIMCITTAIAQVQHNYERFVFDVSPLKKKWTMSYYYDVAESQFHAWSDTRPSKPK